MQYTQFPQKMFLKNKKFSTNLSSCYLYLILCYSESEVTRRIAEGFRKVQEKKINVQNLNFKRVRRCFVCVAQFKSSIQENIENCLNIKKNQK